MLYISKYEPVKSYGFTQRAPKGVNEITLVLLNDIDHARLICSLCNNGVATIFKNWLTLFTYKTKDQ